MLHIYYLADFIGLFFVTLFTTLILPPASTWVPASAISPFDLNYASFDFQIASVYDDLLPELSHSSMQLEFFQFAVPIFDVSYISLFTRQKFHVLLRTQFVRWHIPYSHSARFFHSVVAIN